MVKATEVTTGWQKVMAPTAGQGLLSPKSGYKIGHIPLPFSLEVRHLNPAKWPGGVLQWVRVEPGRQSHFGAF